MHTISASAAKARSLRSLTNEKGTVLMAKGEGWAGGAQAAIISSFILVLSVSPPEGCFYNRKQRSGGDSNDIGAIAQHLAALSIPATGFQGGAKPDTHLLKSASIFEVLPSSTRSASSTRQLEFATAIAALFLRRVFSQRPITRRIPRRSKFRMCQLASSCRSCLHSHSTEGY